MSETKYITVVHFIAFNRHLKESFEDIEPIMRYNIRRRINLICHSSIIMKIECYEGKLVHQEILNKEEWEKSKVK